MSFTETTTEAPIVQETSASHRGKFSRRSDDVQGNLNEVPWRDYEKMAFRFFFIYFALQIVPLDWKYYRDIFSLDWTSLHFRNFFYLSRYVPRIFSEAPVFLDWIVIGTVAVAGTIAWSLVDKQQTQYNKLYYWLRVALRYRLAAALLVYGFIKFFPMQMPEPSISNLNTSYGDLADWKVFSMSTGIVPGYQSFLGLIEISAALLLLYRKTASIGAFIIIPFTGNVLMSNLAYEGGEYVYSLLLISFAAAIFIYDLPRLVSLTSFEKRTLPARFRAVFSPGTLRNVRILAKSTFIFVFVVLYGYQSYASYSDGGYQFPSQKGLVDASGIYNVSTFRLNGKEHPYSTNDPIRWKDVVFEKWNTISIRSHSTESGKIVTATTEEVFQNDSERNYEFSGSNGRQYYSYTVDNTNEKLSLQNRNPNYAVDHFELTYSRPEKGQIVLSGINAANDSIYVVLDRIPKKYLLEEAAKQGRRRGLKL